VVLYLGLDQCYGHLLHHNFVFSRDPEEEFEAIYRRGEPAPDPTCYVCAPARTEPGVAPPGGEALYVLVHTPYLRPGHDWDRMFPAYREKILEKLAGTGAMKDLPGRIRVEHRLTPADIHRRYGVLSGAIYGIASHGRWFGAFKPSNRSPDVRGLYLAGGAAHPGPGMPMVLMSGWIAADALDQDGVAAARPAGSRAVAVASPASAGTGSKQHGPRADAPAEVTAPVIERHSPLLFRMFRRHAKRFYLARHFHAVRLSRGGPPPAVPDGPLVIVLNHPSWWDPLVGLALTELFPGRTHFVPMERQALGRYRFFERLGAFGIEPGTPRGAREFLRTSSAILARPGTALWITAQGRFADARERPPGIRPGVGHLLRRLKGAVLLPLALEYPFWEERYPEALARFGPPIVVERGADRDAAEWRLAVESALADTQDALALESQGRAPAAFVTLVGGNSGIGGIYDRWRRLRSLLSGVPFRPGHAPAGVRPAAGDAS
jgi:1-acyl-sn-glycerol-3-phosphate acyltransferase